MKKWIIVLFVMFFAVSLSGQNFKQRKSVFKIKPALTLGIGSPKLPPSNASVPFSLTGSASLYIPILKKITIQFQGIGLTTVNLGSITDKDIDLRFNVFSGSANLMYRLREGYHSSYYFSAGYGTYDYDLQINDLKSKTITNGMSLALTTLTNRIGKLNSVFELKWHLLFDTPSDIQILTISMGLML